MSRRILIIKPSSLGDIIHALPVLHALRQHDPDAVIDWLVNDSFAAMIRDLPQLNDVILFERNRFRSFGKSASATRDFFRFAGDLRRRRYDVAVDLQGLFRSGLLTYATRAPKRIGFTNAREGAWLFYNQRVAVPDPDAHAVDRNMLIAAAVVDPVDAIQFDLALTEDEHSHADKLLTDAGIDPGEPFIAVMPGARWETKRWPPARFSQLIDRLHADGHRCILLGAPDETDLCRAIAESCTASPPSLAGKTSLRQLTAVLDRAAVVLTHDSGPMHIADAVDTPLVAICGPTNPSRTGPYRQRSGVIQADLPCVPCYLKHLHQCRYDQECMTAVTVELVAGSLTAAMTRAMKPG